MSGDAPDFCPRHAMALAPASQGAQPAPRHLVPECCQGSRVGGHSIVVVVSGNNLSQPAALVRDGIVATASQLSLDFQEFGPLTFSYRVAHEQELPAPSTSADVGKTEGRRTDTMIV